MYRQPRHETVAIASGDDTSAEIHVGDYTIAGIQMPAAITSTSLTFYGSATHGGTYAPIYDSDGNAIAVPVAASRAIGLSAAEADALAPWPWVKVVMGSNEGADRELILVLK